MARFTWSEISQHVSFIRCHFSRAELELCTRTRFACVFLNALHPGGPQLHVRISAVNHWCAPQQYGHVELEAFTLKCIWGGFVCCFVLCWRVFCFILGRFSGLTNIVGFKLLCFVWASQLNVQQLFSFSIILGLLLAYFFYAHRERTLNGWAEWEFNGNWKMLRARFKLSFPAYALECVQQYFVCVILYIFVFVFY